MIHARVNREKVRLSGVARLSTLFHRVDADRGSHSQSVCFQALQG